MEIEQADAGQDGRTRRARPNSQARTGDRIFFIFLVQLTTNKTGLAILAYPVDIEVTTINIEYILYTSNYRLQPISTSTTGCAGSSVGIHSSLLL